MSNKYARAFELQFGFLGRDANASVRMGWDAGTLICQPEIEALQRQVQQLQLLVDVVTGNVSAVEEYENGQ